MKDNNRNYKYTQKKNNPISKKEIKIVNNILDFKKVHKSNLPNNNKKVPSKPSPRKLEPIKVRLTPINRRPNSKGKQNLVLKDTNFNSIKTNNSVYLSPTHGNESKEVNKLKIDKKITYTENRNDIKEDRTNRNCSTPYRKILNIKPKESFSPSTSVIIKNFNYNNVYNINIDQNKKNNKFNKTFNNNYKNIDNNNDNESLNKLATNKELLSKKITYNKPKTTSNMNATCVLSKRNKSKEINFRNNMNMPISQLITNESNLENKRGNETPNRNKTSNNFNLNKKTYLNDYNTAAKTINNNNTYSKNFMSSNSYSNLNNQRKAMNKFYNNCNISLNNTYNKRNLINSPKVFNKYSIKTEANDNDTSIISKINQEFNFNLNDLFIFEDRINDIVSAFNKTNNIYDIEASNECNEFINFYSKSSLKGLFSTFFKENNKLIIESSINLSLFFISIIYNLSSNNFLFKDIIVTINNILSFLKINFALYIKKIQLFYDFDLIKKNYIYFQPFNNFLVNQNIKDLEEEDDITYKIYQNCRSMTNDIKIIMKYYQKIDLNYYNFFIKIFNNISIQKENDILNYFASNINKVNNNNTINLITVNKNCNNTIKDSSNNINNQQHKLKKNKTNINLGYFSPYKRSTIDKSPVPFKTPEKIYLKSPMRTIKNEKINKIEIPYIKVPSQKKYTLVLDLNKTLAFSNRDNNVTLRNGLFSFLSMIKPYYELISFSCEPNEVSNNIIKEIESQKKYFDYNFSREHSILYENTLVKDISLIGRDISKVIIIDDDENCFKLNKENGIKIKAFNGNNRMDNALFELKKILILIHKKNYEDVRSAIKEFSNDIKNKVSLS